jgi:hypothetical protein
MNKPKLSKINTVLLILFIITYTSIVLFYSESTDLNCQSDSPTICGPYTVFTHPHKKTPLNIERSCGWPL